LFAQLLLLLLFHPRTGHKGPEGADVIVAAAAVIIIIIIIIML